MNVYFEMTSTLPLLKLSGCVRRGGLVVCASDLEPEGREFEP